MKKMNQIVAEVSEPSEYLQEVLATPPRWVLRWGETLVLMLVVLLLILSWFIRYPDRISGEVLITTPQPPVPIKAKANGALIKLPVSDREAVVAGQLLAILQTPARYSDITQLKEQLRQFDPTIPKPKLFTEAYQLGTLQEAYAQLQQVAQEFRSYQEFAPHSQQKKAVGRQIARYRNLLNQKKAIADTGA